MSVAEGPRHGKAGRKADSRVARSLTQYERLIRVDPSGLGLSASTSQLADSFLFRGAMAGESVAGTVRDEGLVCQYKLSGARR